LGYAEIKLVIATFVSKKCVSNSVKAQKITKIAIAVAKNQQQRGVGGRNTPFRGSSVALTSPKFPNCRKIRISTQETQ
jgi:hypothetical protein